MTEEESGSSDIVEEESGSSGMVEEESGSSDIVEEESGSSDMVEEESGSSGMVEDELRIIIHVIYELSCERKAAAMPGGGHHGDEGWEICDLRDGDG